MKQFHLTYEDNAKWQPMGVSTYTIKKILPKEFKKLLPSVKKMEAHLNL